MKKKKIVSVISNVYRSKVLESTFKKLSRDKYDHHIIVLAKERGVIIQVLKESGLPVYYVPYRGKMYLLSAFFRIFFLLRKIRPDILHCQLFEGSLLGMAAGRLAGIAKRIYTRHHTTFHHVSHPSAVKYDRFINRSAHHIVAVSDTVRTVLEEYEGVSGSKISVIHHGFDLQSFVGSSGDNSPLLKKYGIENRQPRIGVISRFTDWKGIRYILEAFREIHARYPESVLLLANPIGEDEESTRRKLSELPAGSFRILDFVAEPAILYSIFDVFIHVPIDELSEAFGQVYIEAMASGTPSVFTRSGIGNSILTDGSNCLIVPYKNSSAIKDAVFRILDDKLLSSKLVTRGRETVLGNFETGPMIRQLEDLYDRL